MELGGGCEEPLSASAISGSVGGASSRRLLREENVKQLELTSLGQVKRSKARRLLLLNDSVSLKTLFKKMKLTSTVHLPNCQLFWPQQSSFNLLCPRAGVVRVRGREGVRSRSGDPRTTCGPPGLEVGRSALRRGGR
jgi:hypothetical protein